MRGTANHSARRPLVIAHRTCPRHEAENSVAGIHRAKLLGADGVEFDVRSTADAERVMMHDRTPFRTTNGFPWPVSRSSLRRLRGLTLRGTEDQSPATLSEGLAALDDGMLVAIEVKDRHSSKGALADIRDAGVSERTLLWSYSVPVVQWFLRNASDVEVSLLRDTRTAAQHRRFLHDAAALGTGGLSVDWSAIDEPFVAEAKRLGLKVYSLCETAEADPKKLELVTGVITDWPAEVAAQLDLT